MSTRQSIIELADQLIRDKGYNAFSFYDISRTLGIKNASIHYYFPTKGHLGVAVVQEHNERLQRFTQSVAGKDPLTKLKAFIHSYAQTRAEDRICIVGSLSSDLHTVEETMKTELEIFAGNTLQWLSEVLQEGRSKKVFDFKVTARAKALMIITNMLASLQLTRVTGQKDFTTICETIIKELKPSH
jgi:TetR/AcrR family transcriptional regulator, transcriptional repressor for nem operon